MENFKCEKLFIIVMPNNTPEAMTEQQRCHQKCLGKGRGYPKENNKKLQKVARLKKKKKKKAECMLKVNITICLKKTKKKE